MSAPTWMSQAIADDPTIAAILDLLESHNDVTNVMAQLGAHEYSFALMSSGKVSVGISRTDMRDGDWLTPLHARIIFDCWRERIEDHIRQVAAKYGELPAGRCRQVRYRYCEQESITML